MRILGDIAPGETATARYVLVADQDAEPGVQTFRQHHPVP